MVYFLQLEYNKDFCSLDAKRQTQGNLKAQSCASRLRDRQATEIRRYFSQVCLPGIFFENFKKCQAPTAKFTESARHEGLKRKDA